jgi:outer membrane protein assembly factor BamB
MRFYMTILITAFLSHVVVGQDADFYVTDAESRIYAVDKHTLQATEIFQINTAGLSGINEIMYTGGDTMLANVTGRLVQYNMNTGEESIILDMTDYYSSGYQYTSGLVRTVDDQIGFAMNDLSPAGTRFIYATFDPFTNQYQESASFVGTEYTFFDLHQVSTDVMLGTQFNSQTVTVFDPTDGSIIERYSMDYGAVSFVEINGDLFTLDQRSNLYAFDASTGESSYFGSISGVFGYTIGATTGVAFRIPSPGSSVVLAFAGMTCIRRRRT